MDAAVQQWYQIDEDDAQILQMVGRKTVELKVQIGEQWLDLAQKVDGLHVEMTENFIFLHLNLKQTRL